VIDRLTLRLFNRRQVVAEDFEGGEKGLRLGKEALRRYFAHYEEQMSSPSEGKGSPNWRQRLTLEAQALQKMVMAAEVGPLFTWKG
jgi:CRISPR/Cas system-associated endonuclease Cas1